MELSNLKNIAVAFYYYWHNAPGNNTAEGFDDWIEGLKSKIMKMFDELSDPESYGYYKRYIVRESGMSDDLVTILLKELKEEGKLQIKPMWDEGDSRPAGSGYFLVIKKD